MSTNKVMTAAIRLRRSLDSAAHEVMCGTPLSCGDAHGCAGRIEPRVLDAIMERLYIEATEKQTGDRNG